MSSTAREKGKAVSNNAMVNLADVFEGAKQISTEDLQSGMAVWDSFGVAYTLDRVTHFKRGCRTRRSDGYTEWWDYGETITVRLPDMNADISI